MVALVMVASESCEFTAFRFVIEEEAAVTVAKEDVPDELILNEPASEPVTVALVTVAFDIVALLANKYVALALVDDEVVALLVLA
jgi:hypothetical protein